MAEPLLQIRDLAVSFAGEGGKRVQAVDGVRLTIHPRQTVALVGESGCGKSVTAMSVLHLIPRPPGRFDGGQVFFQTDSGQHDLLTLSEKEMRSIRGNNIAMIFQEPMTSLNPVYTIGEQIIEAVRLHQNADKEKACAIALSAMQDVGIANAAGRLNAYPHQFSGGMRQRVMIAMALACKPRLLIADEPTTALDVTIQAQILELLRNLQRDEAHGGMSIMLITHALGVVAENADVVCVMYAGRVVEYATVLDLFDKPLHPYTRGLLASIPKTRDRSARLTTISQIVDDEAQFAPIAGARPWWPSHQAGNTAYDLAEVEPNHWVGVWAAKDATPGRFPDLPFRMPANSGVFHAANG